MGGWFVSVLVSIFETTSGVCNATKRNFCATVFQTVLRFSLILPGLCDASVCFVGAAFSIFWVSLNPTAVDQPWNWKCKAVGRTWRRQGQHSEEKLEKTGAAERNRLAGQG